MHTILDVSTITFHPQSDRVEGDVIQRDLWGRAIRHRLSAVAHPAWGLPQMARALDRAAQRLDT